MNEFSCITQTTNSYQPDDIFERSIRFSLLLIRAKLTKQEKSKTRVTCKWCMVHIPRGTSNTYYCCSSSRWARYQRNCVLHVFVLHCRINCVLKVYWTRIDSISKSIPVARAVAEENLNCFCTWMSNWSVSLRYLDYVTHLLFENIYDKHFNKFYKLNLLAQSN